MRYAITRINLQHENFEESGVLDFYKELQVVFEEGEEAQQEEVKHEAAAPRQRRATLVKGAAIPSKEEISYMKDNEIMNIDQRSSFMAKISKQNQVYQDYFNSLPQQDIGGNMADI